MINNSERLYSAKALFLCLIFSVSIFSVFSTVHTVEAESQTKSRAELEAELRDLETQIAEQRKNVTQTQSQSASLKRDIAVLQEQINLSKKVIKSHDLAIARISDNIKQKDGQIVTLNSKLDTQRVSLGQIFRKQDTIDAYSLVNYSTQNTSLSEFFADSQSFGVLQKAITANFYEIQNTKQEIHKSKEDLEDAKYEELAEKQKQAIEMREVDAAQRDRKDLLTITKGEEAKYKKMIADREARAGQIKSALFTLNGAGDISFGKALDLAQRVEKSTGVRAAFILGVIRIESNLGQNVGKGNWKDDMHPTRDQPVFEKLMTKLGLDPDKQPVSKKAWYGYGGAMGPAQFIPSTWVMYEKRISALTGNTTPSPWNVEDAFTAAALLLKDNGAKHSDNPSEHRAAMCYLAGCGNAKKASLQFYGDNVLKYAKEYEEKIKILNQ